ncbi:hypothetical protein E2C01_087597 [Portunus trituberculatus]|uniref:Uncharacterized protein n=1 Tax=Portunus trituberculatus TaxID=210409 RepID=A0A5B7JCX1_PORTR|nr:hypothetical protein [Portunus trituberculatus]
MTIAIELNHYKYSVLTSNNTLHRGKQASESGSHLIERSLCSFSLINSNLFSTSEHHTFKPFCDVTT